LIICSPSESDGQSESHHAHRRQFPSVEDETQRKTLDSISYGSGMRTHFTFRVDTWTLTAKALSSTSQASRTIRLHSLSTARRVNAGPARPSPCGKVRECRRLSVV